MQELQGVWRDIKAFNNMEKKYLTATYDYDLPPELIAQEPISQRDTSRLMALDCGLDTISHHHFTDIKHFLRPGDLLVVNDTKVFPARLFGRKETGGKVEILFLNFPEIDHSRTSGNRQLAKAVILLKSSKRPRPGSRLYFGDNLECEVKKLLSDGKVEVELQYKLAKNSRLEDLLEEIGQVPLPPYIRRSQGTTPEDVDRYQTRYAARTGAVAAPTAGLHFSDSLLADIKKIGVQVAAITLHVGYGTFAPVRSDDIRDHQIHAEYIELSKKTADIINSTKAAGNRIWAVGTTTVRVLESSVTVDGKVAATKGWCDFYIYPGHRFQIIDNLITNFHLPCSSLLFLVSALAGRKRIARCYLAAVEKTYRFFSYGDAMAIITKPCTPP